MTLCTAYIRKAKGNEELIFATDSEFRGNGEKWDKGVKLFSLPNNDGLICFTGTTTRAYPLILNLLNTIRYEDYFNIGQYLIQDLVDHISELFSQLILSISDTVEDVHLARSEARFLFGSWDWTESKFRIWMIRYDTATEKLIAYELTDDEDVNNFFIFIGEASNHENIEEKALEDLTKKLKEKGRLHKKLDMEPLEVLRDIALEKELLGVGGSLQIAKISRANKVEFHGIYWPSSSGKPCFQGRAYKEMNKPRVRYFDPDTFEIFDSDLPQILGDISPDTYGDDYQTVYDAYEETSGSIKADIPEKTKHTLRRIFKDVAYRRFLQEQEDIQPSVEYAIEEEE